MKTYFILVWVISLMAGCADNQLYNSLGASSPVAPADEILINNKQFDKPYKILGLVQYTLKKRPSLLSDRLDFREQAIELLKQQTYARFGDEVDAIIDTKVEESTLNDHDGKLNITHIEGVAISFLADAGDSGKTTSSKTAAKRKPVKTAKKILVIKKAKPARKVSEKVSEKPAVKPEEDIQISPAEILK